MVDDHIRFVHIDHIRKMEKLKENDITSAFDTFITSDIVDLLPTHSDNKQAGVKPPNVVYTNCAPRLLSQQYHYGVKQAKVKIRPVMQLNHRLGCSRRGGKILYIG